MLPLLLLLLPAAAPLALEHRDLGPDQRDLPFEPEAVQQGRDVRVRGRGGGGGGRGLLSGESVPPCDAAAAPLAASAADANAAAKASSSSDARPELVVGKEAHPGVQNEETRPPGLAEVVLGEHAGDDLLLLVLLKGVVEVEVVERLRKMEKTKTDDDAFFFSVVCPSSSLARSGPLVAHSSFVPPWGNSPASRPLSEPGGEREAAGGAALPEPATWVRMCLMVSLGRRWSVSITVFSLSFLSFSTGATRASREKGGDARDRKTKRKGEKKGGDSPQPRGCRSEKRKMFWKKLLFFCFFFFHFQFSL